VCYKTRGHYLERFQLDVGLINAIEKHQPLGPVFGETFRHVREVRKEGADLDRQGDAHLPPHRTDNLNVLVFQFRA
jgi:hypothetical protein